MKDKLLKTRLIRHNGIQEVLAWNVTDYEFDIPNKIIHIYHEKGEVIYHLVPGDMIQMLEQLRDVED